MKNEIIIFYGNTRMAFFLQGGQIESENPEIYIGRRKSSINVVSGMRFEMRDGQIVNVEDYGLFCSICPASGKHRSGRQGCGIPVAGMH